MQEKPAPDAPVPDAPVQAAAPEPPAPKAVRVRPALPEKEVLKPLKQKAVIKKAARFQEEAEHSAFGAAQSAVDVPQYMDTFQPPYAQETAWSQLLLQRQAQARMRAEAGGGAYAAMFAAQSRE